MNWPCREFSFGSKEYRVSLQLREEVLRLPLGLSLRQEDMSEEESSYHLGVFQGERLVGSLILKPIDETTLRMRQVAVALDSQGKGAGTDLIAFAEQFALEKGILLIIAHVRQQYLEFYIKRGYSVRRGPFTEVTIPHYAVFKMLQTGA